jgi:hypothetical protein
VGGLVNNLPTSPLILHICKEDCSGLETYLFSFSPIFFFPLSHVVCETKKMLPAPWGV